MEKLSETIRKIVHDVLDEYLAGGLMRDIENEIADLLELKMANLPSDFHDCVNELCQQCGQYKREHEGACDDCRWLKQRRGW